MSNTLYDIQAGDEVVLSEQSGDKIVTVDRITKEYVVIRSHKFRKSNGVRIGTYAWAKIRLLAPDDIERIKNEQERKRLVDIVRYFDYESLGIDRLREIVSIIGKEKPGA